jgi:hypothetical protein
MRTFLYSKWFFLLLAVVCVVDLAADLAERFQGWTDLNGGPTMRAVPIPARIE